MFFAVRFAEIRYRFAAASGGLTPKCLRRTGSERHRTCFGAVLAHRRIWDTPRPAVLPRIDLQHTFLSVYVLRRAWLASTADDPACLLAADSAQMTQRLLLDPVDPLLAMTKTPDPAETAARGAGKKCWT